MPAPRLNLVITEEIEDALQAENEKTLVPISAMVRRFIEEKLEERGYVFSEKLGWGGRRQRSDEAKDGADGPGPYDQ